MLEGTIKKVAAEKGFGFIKENQTGTEYFFHRSGLDQGEDFNSLYEGCDVAFEEEKGNTRNAGKGPRAHKVRMV